MFSVSSEYVVCNINLKIIITNMNNKLPTNPWITPSIRNGVCISPFVAPSNFFISMFFRFAAITSLIVFETKNIDARITTIKIIRL